MSGSHRRACWGHRFSLYHHPPNYAVRPKGTTSRPLHTHCSLYTLVVKRNPLLLLLQLFILLTSENNSSVFSSIERTIRRDIISENSSERVVYLEQAAVVGAWKFKRQFTTACFVTEYMKKLSADFSLAKPGIMASFQVCVC